MKIGIVGGAMSYARPFEQHGGIFTVSSTADLDDLEPDVLVFTGGEDVDPYLYDEHPHPSSYYNPRRDERELAVFNHAQSMGIPSCGICRGSQLLTVAAGGKLVQNIHGHGVAGTHELTDVQGNKLCDITSTHHQMMFPYCLDDDSYDVLAVASKFGHAMEGVPVDYDEPDHVVEAVWYPTTRSLCVQGHPEYMPMDSSGWQWYQSLLNKYIFK